MLWTKNWKLAENKEDAKPEKIHKENEILPSTEADEEFQHRGIFFVKYTVFIDNRWFGQFGAGPNFSEALPQRRI